MACARVKDFRKSIEEGVRCEGLLDYGCLVDSVGGVRGGVVGRRVCDETHGEEDDEYVQPYCGAGKVSVVREGADLVEQHADEDPDDDGDDETRFAVCDLHEALRCAQGRRGDVDDHVDEHEPCYE